MAAYLSQLFLFLHIVSAIMMLAGGIGRAIIRLQAAKATDIQTFRLLIELSGRFESLLGIPGSILVFAFGLILAWMQGWPLFGFLQGAASNWLLVSLILYLALYPLVIFIFIPRGKIFGQLLEAGLARGQLTPELLAAFEDQTVRMAHYVEAGLVAAILYLMVMKPF